MATKKKSRIHKAKREAILSARKMGAASKPAFAGPPAPIPATELPQVTMPDELVTLWDEEIAEAFQKLTARQQSFLLAYIQTGNYAESYRRSYNPLANAHLATVCGQSVMSSSAMGLIAEKLAAGRTADFLQVHKTFHEMTEAAKPNWVQDEAGQWENTGDEPDWRARKDGADGLARLRGLNAPVENNLNIKAKVALVELPTKKALP